MAVVLASGSIHGYLFRIERRGVDAQIVETSGARPDNFRRFYKVEDSSANFKVDVNGRRLQIVTNEEGGKLFPQMNEEFNEVPWRILSDGRGMYWFLVAENEKLIEEVVSAYASSYNKIGMPSDLIEVQSSASSSPDNTSSSDQQDASPKD